MARDKTCKVGIDYFSHDVDMMQDKKVKLLKAKHGLIGYAIYMRLLEELYKEGGYYLKIDEDFNILFSDDNNIPYDDYILILNDCIKNGLFNQEIYEKYSVLTSKRIQLNYFSATERRKEVTFINEYLLENPIEKYSEKVNVNIIKLNVDILSKNADICRQSKKKEKKKVNRKEKESNNSRFTPPALDEVKAYCQERKNKVDAEKFIDHYTTNGWFRGKTKIQDWKACVRTWEKDDKDDKESIEEKKRLKNQEAKKKFEEEQAERAKREAAATRGNGQVSSLSDILKIRGIK